MVDDEFGLVENELNLEKIWNDYAQAYFHITPDMQKELLEKSAKPLFGNILDAGCGVGKIVDYLGEFDSYLGIDSNRHMLDVAIEKNGMLDDVEFAERDVGLFSNGNFYDSVCSVNVLYALDKPVEMVRRVYENLILGGVFVLASPNHSLDMGKLEAIIVDEFNSKFVDDSGDVAGDGVVDILKYLDQFVESNRHLAGIFSASGFKPKLYDENEISSLLLKEGFDILDVGDAYCGQLFYVTCRKI